MADEKEIEIYLKWQDGVYFEMTSKPSGEAVKQIVRAEENGCLEAFWAHISNICKEYISKQLHDIGEELGK